MKKYKITFVHTVEQTYEAIVEAKNKEKASELFDKDPFGFVEDDEPISVDGLTLEITNIEKIED